MNMNFNPPFQSINDASRTTGLSLFYLRKGCREGTIPYVKSGTKYLINVPLLMKKMNVIDNDEEADK